MGGGWWSRLFGLYLPFPILRVEVGFVGQVCCAVSKKKRHCVLYPGCRREESVLHHTWSSAKTEITDAFMNFYD